MTRKDKLLPSDHFTAAGQAQKRIGDGNPAREDDSGRVNPLTQLSQPANPCPRLVNVPTDHSDARQKTPGEAPAIAEQGMKLFSPLQGFAPNPCIDR